MERCDTERYDAICYNKMRCNRMQYSWCTLWSVWSTDLTVATILTILLIGSYILPLHEKEEITLGWTVS